MDVRSAASWFDSNPVYDAYSGAKLFDAQLDLYDGTERDSETATRRVLSTTPDVTLPLRRAIRLGSKRYLLGRSNEDLFQGEVIRVGHVMHEAQALCTLRTLGDACLDLNGVDAWGAKAWLRNAAFTEQSSTLAPEFHLFLAPEEPSHVNQVITHNGVDHLVRAKNLGTAGMQVLLVEEIASAGPELVAVGAGYDPVLGTESPTTTTVSVLRLRWQSLFHLYENGAPTFGPGDVQFAMAKASMPTAAAGMRFYAADAVYRVQSVISLHDAWVCRAVRHG